MFDLSFWVAVRKEQNFVRFFRSGGVDEYVTFGGQISQTDLPRWYHMADLYISPSHVDGSSVSLMEALACGLPCLVSDIPANKEWVFENENGWLFRDGDADHLAEKILAAMNQREKLPRDRQGRPERGREACGLEKECRGVDAGLSKSRSKKRIGRVKMFTFEKLVEGFRELGVMEGDTLLVHSSYKSFGEVDGGPETVVRALEAALGAGGDADHADVQF